VERESVGDALSAVPSSAHHSLPTRHRHLEAPSQGASTPSSSPSQSPSSTPVPPSSHVPPREMMARMRLGGLASLSPSPPAGDGEEHSTGNVCGMAARGKPFFNKYPIHGVKYKHYLDFVKKN